MSASAKFPVLSDSQIEQFRSQARAKRGTAFLAPQLVEHIALLNDHLADVLRAMAEIRNAVRELALAFDAGALGGSNCSCSQDDRVRAAMRRLFFATGDNRSSDPNPVGG